MLARLMLQPADLLVLDEPTNDLDIPTLEVLEEALLSFDGAVVLVTHDRHLIDRVSSEILALDGDGVITRFAEYGQWEDERGRQASTPPAPVQRAPKPEPKPTPSRASKLGYLEQREWDGMEARVLAAEARLDEARTRISDPSIASNAAELHVRSAELATAQKEVDGLYERWAEIETKIRGYETRHS